MCTHAAPCAHVQMGTRTTAVLECTCMCKWAMRAMVHMLAPNVHVQMATHVHMTLVAVLASPHMCKWGHQCLHSGATTSGMGLTSYSLGPVAERKPGDGS